MDDVPPGAYRAWLAQLETAVAILDRATRLRDYVQYHLTRTGADRREQRRVRAFLVAQVRGPQRNLEIEAQNRVCASMDRLYEQYLEKYRRYDESVDEYFAAVAALVRAGGPVL